LKARKGVSEEGFGRQFWFQEWAHRPCWRLLGRFFGGKLAPKRLCQAMDEGGGRNGTKQVENARPRMPKTRGDLVPENAYLGYENREKLAWQRMF